MPTISELRILPPFGIARLGSSPDPMVNYDAVCDPADPLAARRLVGAPTLVVDSASGTIRRSIDLPDVRFRDRSGRIRPVAPFFEVWARVGSVLRPLTRELLRASGFSMKDLTWQIRIANLKIWRRTGDDKDRIAATVEPFADHRIHVLRGRCGNFLPGKSLLLGHVQFIRPTTAFPEIRLRFTPPRGLLYGPGTKVGRIRFKRVYDTRRGSWKGHADPGRPEGTEPGATFASRLSADGDDLLSLGLIDDVADGIIEVNVESSASKRPRSLHALARVAVGPPTFAPDSFPVRTIADEIEQAWLGPVADGLEAPDVAARAEEIVRRAAETVRLMNIAAMNGPRSRDATTTMASHDTRSYGRRYTPVMAPALADTLSILALHRSILAALTSGTSPWFTDALRRHDEIGDLTDVARRKMPALMRGSDGRYLALTRRQVDLIKTAAVGRTPGAATSRPSGKR